MAFFLLEDRYSEIECLAFAQTYQKLAPYLQPDTAVCIKGTISYRENEDPKLLVDSVLPLLDDETYQAVPASDKFLTQSTGNSPSKTEVRAPQQQEEKVSTNSIQKLYLRLPDCRGLAYRKVLNLLEIFEGGFPVVLYDNEKKTYQALRGGVALTDYLLSEFVRLLGKENVIVK